MRVCVVAGARPNFMKIAPVVRALTARGISAGIVHTGQHYDERMSDAFFRELRYPAAVRQSRSRRRHARSPRRPRS